MPAEVSDVTSLRAKPLASLLLLVLTACSTTVAPAGLPAEPGPAEPPVEEPPADVPDPRLDGRPYSVHVPRGDDGSKPLPLLLAFHGYGSDDDGKTLESFFKFKRVADAEGFLYVTPDGLKDARRQRFWNGTDACCDLDKRQPDDVGYVRAIVDDIAKRHNLDRKRVYAFGLSGGGIFVHRLACDAADVFAGVISMSGATWGDASKCKPTEPVAIAEIHGEKDDVVAYDGGELFGKTFPSAKDAITRWASYDGCGDALVETSESYDLFDGLAGAETHVARHDCTRGAAELWTVTKGAHAPAIGSGFAETTWRFLAAHPKP